MRIAAFVLALLGGLAAAALGAKWLSDLSDVNEMVSSLRALGADTGELERVRIGAYLLLLAFALAVVGGILTLRGKGKIGGALMLVAVVGPAIIKPQTLIFTFFLVLGGIFALVSKPKEAQAAGFAGPTPGNAYPNPQYPQQGYPQQGYGGQQGYPQQGYGGQQYPGNPPGGQYPPGGGGGGNYPGQQ